MLISEIFYSIQGEGELTGVPSVFIRTSGCNLRCRWCDTMYASWEPEGDEMDIDGIVAQVCEHPTKYVVVTGGEPMVAKGIADLMTALKQRGKHITIETAGTVAPGGIACDLASLSPKLADSTPRKGEIADGWRKKHESRRFKPEIIRDWIEHYDYQLKFVISEEAEADEIRALVAEVGKEIPPEKILLMPEGIDSATIRSRDNLLIDLCRRYGYRMCNRLHIELFGNARGT